MNEVIKTLYIDSVVGAIINLDVVLKNVNIAKEKASEFINFYYTQNETLRALDKEKIESTILPSLKNLIDKIEDNHYSFKELNKQVAKVTNELYRNNAIKNTATLEYLISDVKNRIDGRLKYAEELELALQKEEEIFNAIFEELHSKKVATALEDILVGAFKEIERYNTQFYMVVLTIKGALDEWQKMN